MNSNLTLQQIGTGNLMACGAREFLENTAAQSLTFRVGSKRGTVEKVIVTLDPCDTYTVRYVAMKGRLCTIVADESREGIYADQLGAVVRKMGDR